MSLIAWNCRGLAKPQTVRFLNEINTQYRPSMIFLSETLVKKSRVEKVSKKLGFVGCFAVDSQGHGGGIALLWKNEGGIKIVNSCNNFIDFECIHETMGRWRYTGYYGFPERWRRRESWAMLKELAAVSTLPWCIFGDFNDLMSMEEKRGGRRQPSALLDGFTSTVMECGLVDLGFTGDMYTWEKSRGKEGWVQERLDRGLATKEWIEMFPGAEVLVHEITTSDHMPLILQLNKHVYVPKRSRFRFENMWIKEDECRSIVQQSWNDDGTGDLMDKLVRCCAKLEEWGGGMVKDLKLKLSQYRQEMKKFRTRRDAAGVSQYAKARWHYLKLLEKKEIFWRQRAKQFWLRDGDKNTRFFHKYASARKEHNAIRKLKNDLGEWKEKDGEIQEIITDYFHNIFSTTNLGEKLSDRIQFRQLEDEQKQSLVLPITEEEVKVAIFAMHPDKAPGIDGLNPSFFQTYWNIVHQDVVLFCQRFFETGELPENINRTLVCLIPKVKHPQKVADLRPISLCNVVMRILSKVMANRVKPTLNHVISEQQSAFIEGRLLTDNALLAFEVNHYMHRKTQGTRGLAGLKIDVSKAYDRLEWSFIEFMLQKLGYPQKWSDRVMQCIKTVSYSFLRDGQIFGDVRPQRGIRQGDPISPYIYILCAEGLSGMMRTYENAGLIHGCKIARGAPPISHLLFADDCYFFFKASQAEATTMRSVLQKYERVSGQVVNYNKSSIVFSTNTKREDKDIVCGVLDVQEVLKPGKYLGMPMSVGRNKVEVFGFLKDKVQQTMQGWANKDISRQGKLTLLSSATQMIPSFWMNLFLIPTAVCEAIERKMNGFMWGRGATGKGVKWMAWSKMCVPKGCGGLGVRDLRKFNLAMLAKQGWRLLQQTNTLVSAVLKARYYPNIHFLDAEVGQNPSYVWRSLMAAMEVLKVGVRRQIGNGRATQVWHIPWLPDKENGYLTTPMPEHLKEITVSGLMDDAGQNWDMDVIDDLFNTRDADLIKCVPIPVIDRRDSWFWLLDDKGSFTVKSCYRLLQGEFNCENIGFWNKLWSLKLPGKVSHFLWRVCKGCLPTAYALAVKHITETVHCPWCRTDVETDTHVLFNCEFARVVWFIAGLQHRVHVLPHDTAFMVLKRIFEVCTNDQCVLVGMISWGLWNRRNNWFWERINGSAFGVKETALTLLTDWKQAQVSVGGRGVHNEVGDFVWKKPMAGWIKVNTDAAVFNDGSIGLGCVMRSAQGEFLGARCCKKLGKWTPREAEAISMKEALIWVLSQRNDHCVVETDSQVLVAACNGEPGESYFGTIVGDCIQLLKHINPVLVRFVYRSANTVAHELAKAAYSMTDVGDWYASPPDFIMNVLDNDLQ